MNWNINVHTTINNSHKSKPDHNRGLTAQGEYWLNRILRDHSSQIFIIAVLFFGLLLAAIIGSVMDGNFTQTDYSLININVSE